MTTPAGWQDQAPEYLTAADLVRRELVEAFEPDPKQVSQLPADRLGDLYRAAALAAAALDAASTFLHRLGGPETAVQLKEAQIRLEHALNAAQDSTEAL